MTSVLYNAHDKTYWIKCQTSELPQKVIPNVSRAYAEFLRNCCSDTDRPLKEEPAEFVYLLVSKEGKVIEPKDPFSPCAELWQDDCPFQVMNPTNIGTLSELHQLSYEAV